MSTSNKLLPPEWFTDAAQAAQAALRREYLSQDLSDLDIIVLHYLQSFKGRANGISASALSKLTSIDDRKQRNSITELRMRGIPVAGTPETGYFMAINQDELNETCDFLKSRAMGTLTMISRLKHISVPSLLGQMQLDLLRT